MLGRTASGANTFVAGIIDIEALRQFRTMNLNSNWMKDLRTEIFQRMYQEPVHPRNLWLDDEPLQHAEVDDIYCANIARLIARGSYTPPARKHSGARYIPAAQSADEADWEQVPAWARITTNQSGRQGHPSARRWLFRLENSYPRVGQVVASHVRGRAFALVSSGHSEPCA